MQPLFIGEVKTVSPFGWRSTQSWDELFEIANEFADMISIHTDQRWGGSFELIRKARTRTDKPVLAKGIHADDQQIMQAIMAGADWVLVVGRVPEVCIDQCILEPLNLTQLETLPEGSRALWNSRDLSNGGPKQETFEQARNVWPGWLCQASNIKMVTDVNPTAEAFLVGTHLPGLIESRS